MSLVAPPPPRSPWQLFYGAAHALRRRWYRRRARRLPRPVLSVGNLHWGGTGKTPLVAALGAHLRDRGLRVAILSRGYRGEGKGVRVVSHFHAGPLLGPRIAGDEPVLLAGELPGVAVVVDGDRHRAGLAALRRLSPAPDLFLLDDGFSHLALHRDLDLLVFPLVDPFAGGRLPPGGRLREPLAAVARAQGILLTGLGASVDEARALGVSLAPYGFGGRAFAAPTRPEAARWVEGGAPPGTPLGVGARVLLVSAIARPGGLRRAAESQGWEILAESTFPDHHAYPEETLRGIRDSFRDRGAEVVLTTTKDRVKLLGRLDLPLAELPVRAEPEPAFWEWLDRRVEELRATHRGEESG